MRMPHEIIGLGCKRLTVTNALACVATVKHIVQAPIVPIK